MAAKQYQSKPCPVDAWQRIGSQESIPVWVPQYADVTAGSQGWNFFTKDNVVVRKNRSLYDKSDCERRTKIESTDWLVVDSDGAFLYDDRTFKTRYELIAQGPGHL